MSGRGARWLRMIKGAQNRIEKWSKQLLSLLPKRSSSILTGIPCAVSKVFLSMVSHFLLPSHLWQRNKGKPSGCKSFRDRGVWAWILFPALKCMSSSTRHKAEPFSMKASDTEARAVRSLVFQAPSIYTQLYRSNRRGCRKWGGNQGTLEPQLLCWMTGLCQYWSLQRKGADEISWLTGTTIPDPVLSGSFLKPKNCFSFVQICERVKCQGRSERLDGGEVCKEWKFKAPQCSAALLVLDSWLCEVLYDTTSAGATTASCKGK